MYLHTVRYFFFAFTLALSIVMVGLAGKSLAYGKDVQNLVKNTLPGAHLDISDELGVGGAVVAAAGVSSLLCLIMAGMLALRPHQKETLFTLRLREGAFGFSVLFWFSTIVAATVIMANRSGKVIAPGIPQGIIDGLVKASGQNLAYSHTKWVKAYVAVGWFAFASTCVNLVLVSLAARHMIKYGPEPTTSVPAAAPAASPATTTVGSEGRPSAEKVPIQEHEKPATTAAPQASPV